MTIINLRDFYYWYTQDEYMEVTDDVAEALRASVRYEAAYQRRLSRHPRFRQRPRPAQPRKSSCRG